MSHMNIDLTCRPLFIPIATSRAVQTQISRPIENQTKRWKETEHCKAVGSVPGYFERITSESEAPLADLTAKSVSESGDGKGFYNPGPVVLQHIQRRAIEAAKQFQFPSESLSSSRAIAKTASRQRTLPVELLKIILTDSDQLTGNDQELHLNAKRTTKFEKSLDALEHKIVLMPTGKIEIVAAEPIEYMDALYVLIPSLRSRYGSNITISLKTNGLLLTRAIADFLLRFEVSVTIRTECFVSRTINPLTHPDFVCPNSPMERVRDVWRHLYRVSRTNGAAMKFSAGICSANADLFAMRNAISKSASDFSGVFDGISIPPIQPVLEMSEEEFNAIQVGSQFNHDDVERLRRSVLRAIVSEPGQWSDLEDRVFCALAYLMRGLPWKFGDFVPSDNVVMTNKEAFSYAVFSVAWLLYTGLWITELTCEPKLKFQPRNRESLRHAGDQ